MEVNQSKVEKNIHSALNFTNDGMNISAFWEKVLCADGHEINPIFIIENIIPLYDTSFNYCIIEESEWNYDKSLKVFYDISTNKIFIKSDTYEKAHNGNIKDTSGKPFPHSHFDTVLSLIESLSASCLWVSFFSFRICAINFPI